MRGEVSWRCEDGVAWCAALWIRAIGVSEEAGSCFVDISILVVAENV